MKPNIWTPPRLDDWCGEVDRDPAQTWLLPGFIPNDAVVMLSGKAKISYKTWLAFTMTTAVATGEPISLFEPTGRGAVLIIEEEGPRKSTRARWRYLENGLGISLAGLPIYFSHRANVLVDDSGWLERICNFVHQNKIRLVILDTIAKVQRGDENSVQDVTKVTSLINKIREANKGNCSVLLLHHLRKSELQSEEADIDDDLRGSSAWAGYYDSHLALRKRQPNQPYIKLIARHKDWEEETYHIAWSIDNDREAADFTLAKADPTVIDAALRDRCLERMAPGEPYIATDLKKVWGLDHATSQAIVDGAVRTKELVRSGKMLIRVINSA